MQSVLIQQIDGLIQRVYEIAELQGYGDRPRKIPYRMLQAMILTSPAYFDMSPEDAADVMGVAVDTLYGYTNYARQNSNTRLFCAMWDRSYERGSFAHPFSIDHVDEIEIERAF
jgi:hypothetical protein